MGGYLVVFFANAPVCDYNKCRKIPHENSICKYLLQPVIESEMPEMLLLTHTTFIGIHLVCVSA